jgi:cyclopropane fatty-acyl-phospholipid synthase-like methyltransferase
MSKRDFDREAATWDQNKFRRSMAIAIADAMASHLELSGSETVLDYGAGTGLVSLRLAPFAKRVLCADSSQGMLDVLGGKIAAAGLANVSTRLLDLEKQEPTSIPPIDVLVSSMALHHIADTAALARRFHSVLRPGGRLAVADLDSEAGDFHADNTGVAHFGFDRGTTQSLFRDAGFVDVSLSTATKVTKPTAAGTDKDFTIFLLTAQRTTD